MSFTVYLDESGITDPQICVVAGFAATSLCWSMFTEEWRGALSEYGVGEFHAQVFFGRDPKGHMVGEYKGWSQDKAGNFLKQLIGVLTTSNPTLAGTAINVVDFLALSAEQRRFLTGGSYHVRSGKLTRWSNQNAFSRGHAEHYHSGCEVHPDKRTGRFRLRRPKTILQIRHRTVQHHKGQKPTTAARAHHAR